MINSASDNNAEFRRLRIAAGLTISEVAALMHCDTRTVQKWEYNERRIGWIPLKLFKILTGQDDESAV